VFDSAEEQFGFVPNVARAMGHSDAVAEGFVGTERELFSTGALGNELLETVGVAVSGANDCEYGVAAHTLSLRRNSEADEGTPGAVVEGRFEELDDRTAAAGFGAAAAEDPRDIPEERYEALEAHFDDQEVVEIAGTAALFAGINTFVDAVEVDLDG
jgi:uncharacterized peroxidase-related enzyme